METPESVSKGCFVFKGKKNVTKMGDYFFVVTDAAKNNHKEKHKDKGKGKSTIDKDLTNKGRLRQFSAAWSDVSALIERMQTDLNTNMFQELLAFIESSAKRLTSPNHTGSTIKEIPTAALLTGVNTSDHGAMFTTFTDHLRHTVTPHIAVLQSRDSTQLKHLLTNTVSQLTDTTLNSLSDDEDDDVPSKISGKMADLAAWYSNKYSNKTPIKRSPSKKRRSQDAPNPALVIVFEDLEGFPAKALHDFIIICSNYLNQLPIVLVFGIATTTTAIHNLLSSSVSSLLSIDKFSALASTHHLSQLIDKVLITPDLPFKLGPRVFQLLLDIFLYHDFSVINFVTALKAAMLDHFDTQPAAILCCDHTVAMETVKSFTSVELDDIRRLPSVMRYIEQQSREIQCKLLIDESHTKTAICEKLQDLSTFHHTYYPLLRCLHSLTHKLPRSPLGKQIRELYAVSLECNISTTEAYKEALSLLKCLSKEELLDALNRTTDTLGNDDQSVLVEIRECLTDSVHRLLDMDNMEVATSDTPDQSPTPSALPKKTDLHSLRKTLSEMKKNKVQSPFENLRCDIVDKLHVFFEENLISPTTLPLHEIYYYDSISTIRQFFYSAPRSALQTALSNPHHYLQCECCKIEPGVILPSMPDVCIVYKLHLECGRFINLYDWLQAFTTVVTEDEGNPPAADVLQARFIRAVSELQFLGFIKATKRKTDHVARLTWGGC